MYACVYVCMCACMFARARARIPYVIGHHKRYHFTYTHTHTHTYTYTHMHAYTHTHKHTHTHTHINTYSCMSSANIRTYSRNTHEAVFSAPLPPCPPPLPPSPLSSLGLSCHPLLVHTALHVVWGQTATAQWGQKPDTMRCGLEIRSEGSKS